MKVVGFNSLQRFPGNRLLLKHVSKFQVHSEFEKQNLTRAMEFCNDPAIGKTKLLVPRRMKEPNPDISPN